MLQKCDAAMWLVSDCERYGIINVVSYGSLVALLIHVTPKPPHPPDLVVPWKLGPSSAVDSQGLYCGIET